MLDAKRQRINCKTIKLTISKVIGTQCSLLYLGNSITSPKVTKLLERKGRHVNAGSIVIAENNGRIYAKIV